MTERHDRVHAGRAQRRRQAGEERDDHAAHDDLADLEEVDPRGDLAEEIDVGRENVDPDAREPVLDAVDVGGDVDTEAQTLLLLADEGTAKEKNYYVNDFGRLQVNAPFQSPHFPGVAAAPAWNDLNPSRAVRASRAS